MGRPYQLVTMSKFLALCMELGAVVRADLGCLSVGAVGDASVLELVEGAGRGTAQSAAARGAGAGWSVAKGGIRRGERLRLGAAADAARLAGAARLVRVTVDL